TPPFTIGPNGQAVVPGADADQNLPDVFGNVKELGPLNSNTTKIGVIHNDALPTLGDTNPNGQVDLRQAWIGSASDADGDDWLYFAWERDAANGSGFIAYEFMQDQAPAACDYSDTTANLIANCNPWANRQAGDFMILWDQQGGSRDLYLRVWSEDANGNLVLSPTGDPLDPAVSAAAYSADGFRGEAALNLTDTVFGGSQACRSFANIIPSTVTGNSDTADYKDTILQPTVPIGNCESTTKTTPRVVTDTSTNPDTTDDVPAGGASIGSGVLAVADSALISITGGTATPAGSVSFFLCKLDAPALCTSGGTSVGSVNLTGASYPVTVQSATAYVTSAGRYCWRAVYTGDPDNGIGGSNDSAATECFTVNPVTPGLATTAGADVFLGSPVTDTATLTDLATQPANPVINLTGTAGPAAGGTITFKLYGPDNCTTLAFTSSTFAVSGNGTYGPASFTPTAPGTYHWVAEYSGNLPNNNATSHNTACTDTNEDVVVNTVASSLTSAQTWVPSDSVTVSAPAGGNLAGTVLFEFFTNGTCNGTAAYTSPLRTVSGASPQTVTSGNAPAQTATGSFSWRVNYDSTNASQRDIPASCHETSALTVTNGGTISSP
ncbi:MAG TPA: hemagglutinin, partial [Intrasporangium sp.]|uniref:hemagglutinin n=1 Tax=Intrasporangium sp. TaxID=1925024 RepID=UPI002B464A0E